MTPRWKLSLGEVAPAVGHEAGADHEYAFGAQALEAGAEAH
jgi:hypothetical protein